VFRSCCVISSSNFFFLGSEESLGEIEDATRERERERERREREEEGGLVLVDPKEKKELPGSLMSAGVLNVRF